MLSRFKFFGFWRSYSFFLTFAVLVSFSVLAVFSAQEDLDQNYYMFSTLSDASTFSDSSTYAGTSKLRIYNGVIQEPNPFGDGWQNLSFPGNASPNNISQSTLDGYWQTFAQATGIASAGGGGLTKVELDASLDDYILSLGGSSFQDYTFLMSGGHGASNHVRDLVDAIALSQYWGTYPLYSTVSGNVLSEDGLIVSKTDITSSLSEITRRGFLGLSRTMYNRYGDTFLQASGNIRSTSPGAISVADFLRNGFLGVRNVLAGGADLSGRNYTVYNVGGSASGYSQPVSNVLDALGRQMTLFSSNQFKLNSSLVGSGSFSGSLLNSSDLSGSNYAYSDILSAISGFGGVMQSDLAKLRYVLASDQDIEIEKSNEPVKDQIVSDFVGSGGAAVKPSNIGDMAGVSADLQSSFSTGANPLDAVGALNGSDAWGFFSADTASLLDTTVSTVDLDQDSGQEIVWFYDPSALDAYLSGG